MVEGFVEGRLVDKGSSTEDELSGELPRET